MERDVCRKILELREEAALDEDFRRLIMEHEALNARLLAQLDTMNDAQRSAVMDYIGLGVEMHLKLLGLAFSQGKR